MNRTPLRTLGFARNTLLGAHTTTDILHIGKHLQKWGGDFMRSESRLIVEPQMFYAKIVRPRARGEPYDRAMLHLPIAVRAMATGILYLALLLLQDRASYQASFTAVTGWSLYLLGSTLILAGIAREVTSS